MTTHMRSTFDRFALAGSAFALVLVATGCSAPDGTLVPSGAPPAVASALASAIDAGASDAQTAILRTAASEGRDVNEEDYRQATEAAMQCTRDTGLTGPVDLSEGFNQGGIYLSIGVVVADPEDQVVLDAMAACERDEQDFVESAYNSRSQAVQWLDDLFQQLKPAFLECLRGQGVEVDDSATLDEILDLDYRENADAPIGGTCVAQTGFEAAVNGM